MGISYRDQINLTNYLISKVEESLAGRNEDECLDVFPHDKYHLGILAPQSNRIGTAWQPDINNEADPEILDTDKSTKPPQNSNQSVATSEQDDEVADAPSSLESEEGEKFSRENILNNRGAPSALGFEFSLVPPLNAPVKIALEVAFAIYTRRFPTWEQQKQRLVDESTEDNHYQQTNVQLADRHKRHDVYIPGIEISFDTHAGVLDITEVFEKAIHAVLEEENKKIDVWRSIPRMSIPRSALKNEATYLNHLGQRQEPIDLPPLSVKLIVRKLQLAGRKLRIGIYLVNNTLADPDSSLSSASNTQRHLYDVRVACKPLTGTLEPIELLSSPAYYQYDPNVWAVGQNCSTGIDLNIPEIWTESLARSDQPRLQSKDSVLIPQPRFDVLSETPVELLSELMESMVAYANDWKLKLNSGQIKLRSEEEKISCQDDLQNFRDEISRFHEGIKALKSDADLLKAFKAMHKVFMRVGNPRGIEKWRLFQIGFIVTQLPALALRQGTVTSDTLDYADVLWFPTGGGKTEAYLGLISCTLLFDRLRGKHGGVSAWLRFPLRMLSVQQLQRAAKVLYETEQERLAVLGDRANLSDPIGLGYFVGKSSTPNQLTDNAIFAGKWKLSELEKNNELRNQLRLVRNCPRCGTQSVEIEVDKAQARIHHVCRNCELNLNIFVSDDEIYRYLPSVLIGTVDKLPSVSWRKEFAHIWGGANARCPAHGYRSGKYCMVYGCKQTSTPVTFYDPIPALLVQDELHLLREELGTFAGHYETLAEACESREAFLPSKIIAATATVEGLDRQTRHLYGKQSRRFPGKGYELGNSFYSEFANDMSGTPKVARRYLAFKPPYLRPPEASARVLEISHKALRFLYSLVSKDGQEGVDTLINEVGSLDANSKPEILALLDKYDATLTYVGSKAHGSRIERKLSDEIGTRILSAGTRTIEVAYLNGESSLDEISNTIDNIETQTDWDDTKRLDAVIGTSLISHGVDVNRFNVMVMSGMPGRTAEYIQASSRCGRTFVGIVVVVLSPWLLREQSFYHRFETYHHHMEHLVEPVPINRFSRFAVNKTMPGVLAGVLNAYFAPKFGLELDKVQNVERALNSDFSEDDLQRAVFESYALDSKIHPRSLQIALQESVENRFRNEIRRIHAPGSADRIANALSHKPMTSLRDIDEPVPFEPKEYAFYSLRWTQK